MAFNFLWMFISFRFGLYHFFSISFPISFFSWMLAFYGAGKNFYQLLIPLMFTAALDVICGIIFALVACNSDNDAFGLNKFLYDHWPDKTKELYKMVNGDYGGWIAVTGTWPIGIGLITIIIVILEHNRLRKRFFKEYKQKYRNKINKRLLHRGLMVYEEEFCGMSFVRIRNISNESSQHESSRNPYAELLAQFPPPPSYQFHSVLPSVQTPCVLSTPPPTYSMLEREGEEEHRHLESTSTAFPQSINNHSPDTTILETAYSSDTASNNSLNESTAMSPSSIVQ